MVRSWRAFPLLLTLLLISIPANAEQVTPSDRVTTHVNVREQPSSQSNIVGTLNINETAELLESVPYWHRIRLSNDTVGYVSKAWSRVTSGTSEVLPTTGKTDLIIGSWNIKWLGYYTQDRHDYPRIADIIQRFDVVAIQELRGFRYRDRLDKIHQ